MLINRIGDIGLAIGISLVFLQFKTVDYLVVFALTPCAINNCLAFLTFDFNALSVICFLLF